MQKPLYIFDFDDTLALSDAVVIITHKDGEIEELTSGEYATYKKQVGDIFDFEQFHRYPPNGRVIRETFVELNNALSKYSSNDVVILTAREYCEPIIKFLKDNGVTKIPTMKCVGGADPMLKGSYVSEKIKEEGYTEVYVFEDSTDNLIAIGNAIKPFKNVSYYPTHVEAHGKQNEVLLRHFIQGVLLEHKKGK